MVAAHPIADFEASGVPDAGHVLAPESPKHEKPFPGPHEKEVPDSTAASIATDADVDGRLPTAEERKSLRLVAAKLPKTAYLICLIEFAERASYFGCVGPFFNYIQQPLPPGGNGWGAPAKGDTQGTAGALGLGLQTATALTTLFTFLAYTIPIAGGIISDTKWGRYKTLWIGTLVGVVAHIILVIAAIPAVIQSGNGLAPFIIAILVLATASGLIKPTVAPLLADQSPIQRQSILTLPTGERVIQDPGQTLQQALMIFYWCINVGAFLQLGTTYIEKRIGFWLAYLVPMFAYLIMPAVLLYLDKRIVKVPAQGSVIVQAGRVSALAIKGRSWNAAIPSQILEKKGSLPSKVTWDDDFIGEMKRTIKACKLFLFLVLFNLADSGLTSVQNSMGAAMTTNGAPNDLLSNFNSICIIVLVPILNYGIYPLLRKHKINFSPIRRILFGFSLGVLTMVASAILQWQVYETSPCGYEATAGCEDANGFALVSPISIWAQIPLYALPAAGEVFVFVTVYEQAILRSPQRMKGLVYAFMLFTTALSSAIVEIISPALHDPHLIWPFVGIAAANVAGMICIWVFFRKMDETEGEDNAIGADREIEGVVHGRQERERREAVKA